MIPVASIRESLEIFAGELEAVIRELPELEGHGGADVWRASPVSVRAIETPRDTSGCPPGRQDPATMCR